MWIYFQKNKYCFFILLFFHLLIVSSCKKETDTYVLNETGFVSDIDNNVYKTVKIGNQWWMAENLKVKTYRNGIPIPNAQSENEWLNASAAYCIYDDNDYAPGLLYNWNSVIDSSNIAPAGWHIPTDQEWKELEIHLGMTQADANKLNWRGTNEGEKLKIGGREGWSAFNNVWATNESGFTALAGSCRLSNGTWGDPGLFATGFWWSSSSFSDNSIWYRYLDYKESRIFRSKISKGYGFSIRCIKDY